MERRIDELGRLVIPRQISKTLGIESNSPIYMGRDDEMIYLSKEPVTDFILTKVDSLGRVNIPIEYRRKLSLPTLTYVMFKMNHGVITIQKSEIRCVMCGNHEQIHDVKGVRICSNCVNEIRKSTWWDVI